MMVDTASSWTYVDTYSKSTDKWYVAFQDEDEEWKWSNFDTEKEANATYNEYELYDTSSGSNNRKGGSDKSSDLKEYDDGSFASAKDGASASSGLAAKKVKKGKDTKEKREWEEKSGIDT